MIRSLPAIPTVLVAAAVAVMISLGFWQLDRREWKEGLIARYGEASALSAEVAWPRTPEEREAALYRRSAINCEHVLRMDAVAGRSDKGQSGWAHVARCAIDGGGEAQIALGWSPDPRSHGWSGGTVAGILGPAGDEVRLVASPPEAGLAQLAAPDARDLPNNHLVYAVQWFFFAATAVVIYVLALRKRRRGG